MRVSRRVDQVVDKLVGFVKNEAARHPDESYSNYEVYMGLKSYRGVLTVELRLLNKNVPRSLSSDSFSLYHFKPFFRHHADSRTLAAMDGAASKLHDDGFQIM